jgi:hypothetical protein
MYVVFLEDLDEAKNATLNAARMMEQVFTQIAVRCGLSSLNFELKQWWRYGKAVERQPGLGVHG